MTIYFNDMGTRYLSIYASLGVIEPDDLLEMVSGFYTVPANNKLEAAYMLSMRFQLDITEEMFEIAKG